MADLHPHSYSAKRLLPCPCCGGKAAFGRDSNPESVNFEGRFVFCEACDLCTTIVFPLKDDVSRELVERWNKRSNGPMGEWRRVAGGELPRGDDEVLAATITGHVITAHPTHIRSRHADAIQNSEDCFYTHWMPLPKGPAL
jgi:hypothetical protein